MVLSRIARMPAAASALARALAVLGDGTSLRAAAELAGLEDAVPALRTLLAAEVVVEGDGLGFVHPIVRAAVYESIADRSALHWRAARVVAAAGDADEAVGAQLLAAQPVGDPWAVERLRAAAQRALGLGDPRGAVTYLRRALAEPPGADGRADVLLELGRAEARAGDPEAIAHLERVMAEAPDARLAAQAALELAPVLKFAGEAVRAVAVTERALERLGGADPELAERLEIEQFGSAYISIAARTLLAPRLAALGEPPQSPTTPFDRFRLAGIAFDAFAAGRPADEVADLATRALAHGALATDPTAGGHAFVSGAVALMFAERYDEADRLYSGALEDARRRGFRDRVRHGVEPALARRLPPRAALGGAHGARPPRFELADAVHGAQGFLAAALGTLVYTALDQGTVDADLEAFAERFVREQAADSLPYSHAMHAHACLRVHRGELEPAYQELLATGRRELEWGARNPAVAAGALDRRARRPRARGRARRAGAGVRGGGAGAGVRRPARARRRRIRAAGLVAEREQGIALLAEAVAVLDRSLGALEHARALIDHGLLLAAVGAEDLSRPRLTAGHALAIRCGAAALAGRAGVSPEPVREGAGARRGIDAVGGARGPDGRGGDDQPRYRPGAVRHAEDGRDAPRQRLPQAGRALAPGAPGGARLELESGGGGGDAQGAPRAVQELGDGVRVHAEPVTDLRGTERSPSSRRTQAVRWRSGTVASAVYTASRVAPSSADCSGRARVSSGSTSAPVSRSASSEASVRRRRIRSKHALRAAPNT